MYANNLYTETETCRCGQRIEYVPTDWRGASGRIRVSANSISVVWSFMHVGGGAHCSNGVSFARPTPRCAKCRSTNLTQEPRAKRSACGSCGFEDFYRIGD